jgi:hypothetical protein
VTTKKAIPDGYVSWPERLAFIDAVSKGGLLWHKMAEIKRLRKLLNVLFTAAKDMDSNFNGVRWTDARSTDKLRWEALRAAVTKAEKELKARTK